MTVARWASVLFCAGAASCVAASASAPVMPAAPQPAMRRGGSIDQELNATGGSRESILWSASRPLRLTDFKAPVPAEAPEGARTAYQLMYGVRCRGEAFHFDISASFLPEHSWIKPRVFTDAPEGRRILNHEQTHFNQTEVYARRMRKDFSQLYDPCRKTEDQLNAFADRFVEDEAAAQVRYDDDTSYGLNPARQAVWDKDIKDALASLQQYKGAEPAVATGN